VVKFIKNTKKNICNIKQDLLDTAWHMFW